MIKKVVEVVEEVTVALKDGCTSWFKAQGIATRAQDKADGITDAILIPAIACGDLATWDAQVVELGRIARTATKAQRKAMGYIQEDKEDAGGNKTVMTVPCKYLAIIFSTIRQTYKRDLPFVDKKGKRVSFNALKTQKAKDIAKEAGKAGGRKGDTVKLAKLQKEQRARCKNYSDEDLHNYVNRFEIDVHALPTSKVA